MTFKVNLKIEAGADFVKQVIWETGTPPVPVDLTGCTAVMDLRTEVESPTRLLRLSTADGSIVLGGTTGAVKFTIPFAATSALTWDVAVYDMFVTFPSGESKKFIKGRATVDPRVTRE